MTRPEINPTRASTPDSRWPSPWDQDAHLRAALELALRGARSVTYARSPDPPYRFHHVALGLERWLLLRPADIMGDRDDWMQRVHPEERGSVQTALAECARTPGLVQDLEYRVRAGDGNWCWIRELSQCVVDSTTGRRQLLGLWQPASQDRGTERRTAAEPTHSEGAHTDAAVDNERELRQRSDQQALSSSEERYRQFLDGSPQAVYIQRDLSLLFVNHAFAEMLGYDSASAVLQLGSVLPLIAPSDIERLRDYAKGSIQGGEVPDRYVHQALKRDGQELTLENRVRAIPWDGTVALEVVVVDVSARREVESKARQLQAELAHAARLSTVGEIAASIAHELNQPLCAATAYAQAAADLMRHQPEATGRAAEILDQVVQQAERAGQIVRHVRDLVRKGDSVKASMQLAPVLHEALSLLEPEAREKGIELQVALEPKLPALEFNPIQLQQVILNLVLNAMEAMVGTPNDMRQIRVGCRAQPDGSVRVAVVDQGPGIDSDKLEKIFEPFESTKPEGMGMGLSISRSIIEAHGGRLWAESGPGPGASLIFVLPAHV